MRKACVALSRLAVGLFVLPALFALASAWPAEAQSIITTKHNLSVSGPGPVKATVETEVCVFCHTPHNASPAKPLWGHEQSAATYTVYTSSTAKSTPSQPDGASKLCLSCHDGTVAVGSINGGRTQVEMAPGSVRPDGALLSTSPSNLGTNLADDHPISSTLPASDPGYVEPASWDRVKLYGDPPGKVQCTSCHDPHDDAFRPFLRKSNVDTASAGQYGGQICLSCHVKTGWTESAHRNATTKLYNGTTVATLACQSCHETHQAPWTEQLQGGAEEGNCVKCHDGTVGDDIKTEVNATSAHPTVSISGVHKDGESLQGLPLTKRHAECADCHSPHAARKGSLAAAPALSQALVGVSGVQATFGTAAWVEPAYAPKAAVDQEYEVCLKCHSSYSYGTSPPTSPSRVREQWPAGTPVPAQTPVPRDFNPNNAATHAVLGPSIRSATGGTGAFVGTDRNGVPWSWQSRLLCSDCHGSNASTAAPQGPHGSGEPFIAKAGWDTPFRTDPLRGVVLGVRADLCLKCHDPNLYANKNNTVDSRSGFRSGTDNLHGEHAERVACANCHSAVPHGWKRRALIVTVDDPYPYSKGARIRFTQTFIDYARARGYDPVTGDLPPDVNWQMSYCSHSACHGM